MSDKGRVNTTDIAIRRAKQKNIMNGMTPYNKPGKPFIPTTNKSRPESSMTDTEYTLRLSKGGRNKRQPSLPKFSWDKES